MNKIDDLQLLNAQIKQMNIIDIVSNEKDNIETLNTLKRQVIIEQMMNDICNLTSCVTIDILILVYNRILDFFRDIARRTKHEELMRTVNKFDESSINNIIPSIYELSVFVENIDLRLLHKKILKIFINNIECLDNPRMSRSFNDAKRNLINLNI